MAAFRRFVRARTAGHQRTLEINAKIVDKVKFDVPYVPASDPVVNRRR